MVTTGTKRIAFGACALAAAAFALGAVGCKTHAAAKPASAFADCDPAVDLERCASDGARMFCDADTLVWGTLGYCSHGATCKEIALPAGATPVGAMATQCEGSAAIGGSSDATVIYGGPVAVGSVPSSDAKGSDASADATVPGDAKGPADAAKPSCGNGVCDSDETAASCAKDCAPPVCGDDFCAAKENPGNCAWDCAAGASAGAQCMIAHCPGIAGLCKASQGCLNQLADVWLCAKGCTGCLSKCLAGADAVVFQVASCGAAACLGGP